MKAYALRRMAASSLSPFSPLPFSSSKAIMGTNTCALNETSNLLEKKFDIITVMDGGPARTRTGDLRRFLRFSLINLVRATSYQTRLRALFVHVCFSSSRIWNTCFNFIKPFPQSRFKKSRGEPSCKVPRTMAISKWKSRSMKS